MCNSKVDDHCRQQRGRPNKDCLESTNLFISYFNKISITKPKYVLLQKQLVYDFYFENARLISIGKAKPIENSDQVLIVWNAGQNYLLGKPDQHNPSIFSFVTDISSLKKFQYYRGFSLIKSLFLKYCCDIAEFDEILDQDDDLDFFTIYPHVINSIHREIYLSSKLISSFGIDTYTFSKITKLDISNNNIVLNEEFLNKIIMCFPNLLELDCSDIQEINLEKIRFDDNDANRIKLKNLVLNRLKDKNITVDNIAKLINRFNPSEVSLQNSLVQFSQLLNLFSKCNLFPSLIISDCANLNLYTFFKYIATSSIFKKLTITNNNINAKLFLKNVIKVLSIEFLSVSFCELNIIEKDYSRFLCNLLRSLPNILSIRIANITLEENKKCDFNQLFKKLCVFLCPKVQSINGLKPDISFDDAKEDILSFILNDVYEFDSAFADEVLKQCKISKNEITQQHMNRVLNEDKLMYWEKATKYSNKISHLKTNYIIVTKDFKYYVLFLSLGDTILDVKLKFNALNYLALIDGIEVSNEYIILYKLKIILKKNLASY